MHKKIEILAPVGDFSCLRTAIEAGADSVYFGIENLNMRSHSSHNFKIEDLKEISIYCKKNKTKTYLTVNTIIYDNDLLQMKKILEAAKEAKITSVIASDLAVLQYAQSIGMPIHISTQANVCNIESVLFFSKYADVIVLARELSLNQIKAICEEIQKRKIKGPSGSLVKIEIFIHGALCVAISGRCYMSLAQYNMSANRGRCLQACRRKYKVIEEETQKELVLDNKYIMSPKDLCTITVLDEIVKSGASILKIEGRARSDEYIKTVVFCYKQALEAIEKKNYSQENIDFWLSKLEKVFNRGFWHGGYYLGNDLEQWSASYGSKATKKKIYIGKVTNYFSKVKIAEILIHAKELKIGDEILIIGNKTGLIESKITNLRTNKDTSVTYQGEVVSFPLEQKVRKNDQLYVVVDNL